MQTNTKEAIACKNKTKQQQKNKLKKTPHIFNKLGL